MLKFLKDLFKAAEAPLLQTPVGYPGAMAEMAEYLILLQAKGTAIGQGRNDTLVRVASTVSSDPYCLGYMTGMFEALCEQWEVPPPERRLVTGSAMTLMFRDMLDACGDTRRTTVIEDAAFNGVLNHAGDPVFSRGRFDGCSELTRYAATREQMDIPARLRERLLQVAAPACA